MNLFHKKLKLFEIKLNFLLFSLSISTDYIFSFFALHSSFRVDFFYLLFFVKRSFQILASHLLLLSNYSKKIALHSVGR